MGETLALKFLKFYWSLVITPIPRRKEKFIPHFIFFVLFNCRTRYLHIKRSCTSGTGGYIAWLQRCEVQVELRHRHQRRLHRQ